MYRKQLFSLGLGLICSAAILAQSTPVSSHDPHEVRVPVNETPLFDWDFQQQMRQQPEWLSFRSSHPTWNGFFTSENPIPHRAYGSPFVVAGSNAMEQAINFIENHLQAFSVNLSEWELIGVFNSNKYDHVNFVQVVEGVEVLNSRLVVKLHDGQVVMFGIDQSTDEDYDASPQLTTQQSAMLASENIENEILSVEVADDLKWLNINDQLHLVYEVMVNTMDEESVPANYLSYVDAQNGDVLSRTNMVMHCGVCEKEKEEKRVRTMGMMAVNGHVQAEIHPLNISDGTAVMGLPNLYLDLDDGIYTDDEGDFSSNETGPINTTIELAGLWSTVKTNDIVPELDVQLAEGNNNVVYNTANIKELSAYNSVNRIHDHMKTYLPDFTGLDFSMGTNIDVDGTCNAFYNGEINFFDNGGGCNATSLLADVVYHEYGHGINDFFYQSGGQNFMNGAMGEGYSDLWGISLTQNPILGLDFFEGGTDGLRRYDINPKVYPQDLVGEVHADGEIICGAWYDTHLLMGDDWQYTMTLFAEAYSGWQATTMNGNEGQAFFDVLIDVLQADDDDADLMNGTPNDLAIIEGFGIHGIFLLAEAAINHDNPLVTASQEIITLEAEVVAEFPANVYLSGVNLLYRTNPGDEFSSLPASDTGDDFYAADIEAQADGTVIEYYFSLEDIYGFDGATSPSGVLAEDPILAYFTLVGVEIQGAQDCDFNEDWGEWETGVSGDLATAGQWELNVPIGSFGDPGDPSTIVAPDHQHTEGNGAEFCFVTGQSPSPTASMYDTDVDDGGTTLRSPIIDLSGMTTPIISYWRWLVHVPNGSSLNDAWIVQVSDNGGSTWTDVERTKTQDRSWRRNAFRIDEYVEITDEFMIQFIADDPVFDVSGALVEAAVDDVYLWDQGEVVSLLSIADPHINVYPVPAEDVVRLMYSGSDLSQGQVQLYASDGRLVLSQLVYAETENVLNIAHCEAGVYELVLVSNNQRWTERIIVK